MFPAIIISINTANLRSLFEWIFVLLAFVYFVYGSFHASLYDDEKRKIDINHQSFRSIHVSGSIRNRFSFGLPIPIFSDPENEVIKKYKLEYNRIILKFWILVILATITQCAGLRN
jgi:hypothetical protein